jgi:hypothetical protein
VDQVFLRMLPYLIVRSFAQPPCAPWDCVGPEAGCAAVVHTHAAWYLISGVAYFGFVCSSVCLFDFFFFASLLHTRARAHIHTYIHTYTYLQFAAVTVKMDAAELFH